MTLYRALWLFLSAYSLMVPTLAAPKLTVGLPLGRTAYQTNERIDLTVIRTDTTDLPADSLTLRLGSPGGILRFTFPLKAVPAVQGVAAATVHLHLDGALLAPGHYTVELTANGATAQTAFDLFSNVRYTDYRLIYWSGVRNAQVKDLGAGGVGFNMLYGASDITDQAPNMRAGLDFMTACAMGGAHQLDMRLECDWSDPYAFRGGTRRVMRVAMQDRTAGNVLGVHFYDEPGLASWHYTPAQQRVYEATFGEKLPLVKGFDKTNLQQTAAWTKYSFWKESFMDAAWKHADWAVTATKPDWISATQSQYGWFAFSDGYYFNVSRSLPVASGHGGYDDNFPFTYFPAYCLEMALARDMARPAWYCPMWFGGHSAESYRAEQNMCFAAGIQGSITSPNTPLENLKLPADVRQAVIDCNRNFARLGPVFTTMPKTHQPVGLFYSLSSEVQRQINKDLNYGYPHDETQNLAILWVAGKIMQTPMSPIVEEDVLDGTLARTTRVLICTRLIAVQDGVAPALESFITHGGTVLLTPDCTVPIKGAITLKSNPRDFVTEMKAALKVNDEKKLAEILNTGAVVDMARSVAVELAPYLRQAGVQPAFLTNKDEIVAGRQAYGDVEYLFAINSTYDRQNGGWKELFDKGGRNNLMDATATLSLPADGRPVYDGLAGGPVKELKTKGKLLAGTFTFGAGDMRVFARTARPIGRVLLVPPVIEADNTPFRPQHLTFAATLLDTKGSVLDGSAPMRVQVTDPAGKPRYTLYRATEHGTLRLSLPFGLNEPAGAYTVTVTDLLAGKVATAIVSWQLPTNLGSVVGMERRGVTFGNDREQVYHFFRTHQDITIAKGSSDYDTVAAQRLSDILKPWDIRCTIIDAAGVKSRPISEEEAKTWVGMIYGKAQVGDNPPEITGFDVRGAVILIGNAEDNPLIAFAQRYRFLPYTPAPGVFPGPGRGLVSWQLGAIGQEQESLTLIAHDAAGMAEAVGTCYDAAIGMDPLTPWEQPATAGIEPVKKSSQ